VCVQFVTFAFSAPCIEQVDLGLHLRTDSDTQTDRKTNRRFVLLNFIQIDADAITSFRAVSVIMFIASNL